MNIEQLKEGYQNFQTLCKAANQNDIGEMKSQVHSAVCNSPEPFSYLAFTSDGVFLYSLLEFDGITLPVCFAVNELEAEALQHSSGVNTIQLQGFVLANDHENN